MERMPVGLLLLTIHFVRHGETTANREGIVQGQQDYELTPLGINQAVATADHLRSHKYWQAHTSDLVRASRTAEIIFEERNEPTLVKSSLLREFALGVQEGLPRGTSWSEARQIKSEQAGVPEERYVESRRETPSDVLKRAQEFLSVIVTNAAREAYEGRRAGAINGDVKGKEKHPRLALVVSHGGFLNVAMLAVMGLGDDIGFMSNCAVAIIDVFEKEGGRGVSYVPRELNDESHLFAAGLSVGRNLEDFKK